jgi:ATP-binding cassette subfamily B protein
MQVVTPKMLGSATTEIFRGITAKSGINFSTLVSVLLIVGVLYLGAFLSKFLQQRLMTVVSLKTTETLRNAVKAKLNKVPISYFDRNSTGNLMSIALNDIDNIGTNLQQSLTQLISNVILLVGMFVIMLTINPLLTLLACVMIPASTIIAKLLTPAVQNNYKKYLHSMGAINGSIEETYQNFIIVKSYNGEKDALNSFCKSNTDMRDAGWKAIFFGSCMMQFMMLVQNAIYVLIAAIGAIMVISGKMFIGDMQAFLQYSQQFTSPVSMLSQIWASLLSVMASAERVFELLDTDEMENYPHIFDNFPDDAKVVFDHIQFGYTEKPLMSDFNLKAANGQTIAIVGHTGAGKTTLVNLLERFYEIQKGSIRVGGSDIRNIDYKELRHRMGMVLQDTWLFSGTIFDNIKYGNVNATDEQVYAAAKAAYAEEFIEKLPDGYNTLLAEDADNISQGQKQLITIARAFVADPEILILDEATSSVDSRTEMIVQKAMKKLMEGRTSFVIAHRLSTVYDADRIIVMENGDIVETGTHQELIAQNGTYADIYDSQFAGYVA